MGRSLEGFRDYPPLQSFAQDRAKVAVPRRNGLERLLPLTVRLRHIAPGAISAAWIGTRGPAANPTDPAAITPWRTWALAGATTSLFAYLVEYFPGHMDLRLQVSHPVYGVAWLGIGEGLAQIETWAGQRKSFWNFRRAGRLVLALAAVAALPVAVKWSGTPSLLTGDPAASRLDWLPNGVVAQSFSAWLARDGLTGAIAALQESARETAPAGTARAALIRANPDGGLTTPRRG